MAAAKKKTDTYKVSRRRDGDMNDAYVCVTGTDGKLISTKVPLDTEVQLDPNVVKSLNRRTEMCRTSGKGRSERLEAKSTYFIEKIKE